MSDPHPPTEPTTPATPPTAMSERQTYNVISDTVTGLNVRGRDNLLQAIFVAACLVVGITLGILFLGLGAPVGAIIGAAGGLLLGVFLSGAFLGVFRLVKHVRGQHD